MYKKKKIIAIIPARGGSKGLPGKNIKEICGKPLIAWSIEAALKCELIDEVMVTTDSSEIAKISKEYGASVPFLRPDYLAEDSSTSFDAIIHTLNYYKELENNFEYLILLEPTSPLREIEDLNNSIKMVIDDKYAESLVGVCKTECQHPSFLVEKNKNELISGYTGSMNVLRRQELDDVYFLEGSMYVSSIESYFNKKTFYHEKTIGFEVEKYKSFEIDDIYDFKIVEALLNAKLNKEI